MSSPISSEPKQLDAQTNFVDAECSTHGPYKAAQIQGLFDSRPITMGCSACISEARTRAAEEKELVRQRAHQEKVATLFKRSGIPRRFQDRTFDNYRAESEGQKLALRVGRRFVDSILNEPDKGASIILCGNPGTGKTHLACAVGRAITEQLRSVQFGTVLSMIRHVKDTYRKDSDRSERDAIADLLEPDLLIMDEIGVQIGSEHEKMLVFEIINERYQDCRSIILISNLNREELTAYLGDRVMDRFRESGGIVAFDWASHRGKVAA